MLDMGKSFLPDDVNSRCCFLLRCTTGFRKVIWRGFWWMWYRRWI